MRVQGNTDRTLIGVKCRWPVAQPARQDSCALRCRKNGQIQLPALHSTSPFPKSHENAFSADSSTASAILCKQPASILHKTTTVQNNTNQYPFVWIKRVDQLLEKGQHDLTFSRILDRSQLEFPTVRSSRFVVGFLCLSSLANAAGGKFANELCGRWTL